ncbi:Avirulence (Avh) protein [Phytophthora megakarya]|uniref:Avirulence (Avh) protein n=1 Tax=Phytophthora megakarya TaxID=4795 RepID=A0A225UPL5_9STRA|nr:Avirulence (Avh) protein [Phytophthora megakarya]
MRPWYIVVFALVVTLDPTQFFKQLRFDKVEKIDEILSNKQLQLTSLGGFMDDYARLTGKQGSVAKLFTNKFGTENYAQMLTAAKENTATAAAATTLQDDLLKQLLKNHESPEGVAKMLGLGRGQQIARHVNAEALNKYTRNFYAKYPNPKSGIAPLQIFKKLELDKIDDFVTNAKQINILADYMEQYAKLNPWQRSPTMVKMFSDEVGDKKLAEMLTEATKNPEMKKFATDMQRAHLSEILRSNKPVPPKTVFKWMHLQLKGSLNVADSSWVNWGWYNSIYRAIQKV